MRIIDGAEGDIAAIGFKSAADFPVSRPLPDMPETLASSFVRSHAPASLSWTPVRRKEGIGTGETRTG